MSIILLFTNSTKRQHLFGPDSGQWCARLSPASPDSLTDVAIITRCISTQSLWLVVDLDLPQCTRQTGNVQRVSSQTARLLLLPRVWLVPACSRGPLPPAMCMVRSRNSQYIVTSRAIAHPPSAWGGCKQQSKHLCFHSVCKSTQAISRRPVPPPRTPGGRMVHGNCTEF